MKKRNLWLVPLITMLVISLSLSISIYTKIGQTLDAIIISRYILVGVIGFIFSFILRKYNQDLASNIFLLLSIISGLILFIQMPDSADGFAQLGAIIMWMMMMGLSIILALGTVLVQVFKKRS